MANKMEKEKFYFKNEDATNCYPLEYHLKEAKDDVLKEITLTEAIPDDGTEDYVWCQIYDCVQKSDCSKSVCPRYESKSGRCLYQSNSY